MNSRNNNNKRGKKQIQQLFKPRPRQKPGWDDSISDLNVHKLSKEELDARKRSMVSNNVDKARDDLYEKKPAAPQYYPSFFHHLDAQIDYLIRERGAQKEEEEMEGEEGYSDDENNFSQPALPSTSRFSVVPEVTLAPHSKHSKFSENSQSYMAHPNGAPQWEEQRGDGRRGEREEEIGDEEEEEEEKEEGSDDGETWGDPTVTPAQTTRRELRPTPMPNGNSAPMNYNKPKIDASNVMRYHDSIHNGAGTDDVAYEPDYKKDPARPPKQGGGNTSANHGRPSSAGVRSAQGFTVDLEEEIENFKKQNTNNRPNSRNKNRPNSAIGMRAPTPDSSSYAPNGNTAYNNYTNNKNDKIIKKNSAQKPPLRPQHNNSTLNSSNDNLANLNGSFTHNLSANYGQPQDKHHTKITNHNNITNGVNHNVQSKNGNRKSNDSMEDVGRDLENQVNNLAHMRINKHNELANSSQFLVGNEEQHNEDSQQRAVLWEAIQNQITKIALLEKTVSTLYQEKEELHRHFVAFQQLTSEKFILVQQVLAQYVRSAELEKLGLPITSHLSPSHHSQPSTNPSQQSQFSPSQQPPQYSQQPTHYSHQSTQPLPSHNLSQAQISPQSHPPQQPHHVQQPPPHKHPQQSQHPSQPQIPVESQPSHPLQQPHHTQQLPTHKNPQQSQHPLLSHDYSLSDSQPSHPLQQPHHTQQLPTHKYPQRPQQTHEPPEPQLQTLPQAYPQTHNPSQQPIPSKTHHSSAHTFPQQQQQQQQQQQGEDYYTFFQKAPKPPTPHNEQSHPPSHPNYPSHPSHSSHPSNPSSHPLHCSPHDGYSDTRDTSEYNEYSKALLERQRKFLSSPRERGHSNHPPSTPLPTQKNQIPQSGFGSVVKDVEIVEGPRKLPQSLRAQNMSTFSQM